jgi:hypothetical protein
MKKKTLFKMASFTNADIVKTLNDSALEAFKKGDYFQSAIINFQRVEILLRLVVHIFARNNGAAKDIIEKIEDEKHFFNLVIFLGLVKPDNGITERLFSFNTKRNDFMHKLFYVGEPINSLKKELKDFSIEGVELSLTLSIMIGIK